MPEIIRPYQRIVTAINPHQGNRRFLIPRRGKPGAGPAPGPSQSYTLTAGGTTNRGFIRSSQGSLSPDVTFGPDDRQIHQLTTNLGGTFDFRLVGASIPNLDRVWSTVEIDGVFETGQDTQTVTRSDATYQANSGGNTRWTFTPALVLVSGNDYALTVNWVDP